MTKLPDLPRPTPAEDAPKRYLEPLDPLMMDAIPKQPKGDGNRTRKTLQQDDPQPKQQTEQPKPTPVETDDEQADPQAWRGVLVGAALAVGTIGAALVIGKALSNGPSDPNPPDSSPSPRSDAPGRTLE